MRSMNGARRVRSALALVALVSSASPALADGKHAKGSIAACATFDQKDASETSVDFTINNACTVAVTCKVTWSLTCAPDSHKRRTRTTENASFALDQNDAKTTTASAAKCGDDSWSIDDVSWSCEPVRD
jgi:hypothetical protein